MPLPAFSEVSNCCVAVCFAVLAVVLVLVVVISVKTAKSRSS
jgi:hypothetical protein